MRSGKRSYDGFLARAHDPGPDWNIKGKKEKVKEKKETNIIAQECNMILGRLRGERA